MPSTDAGSVGRTRPNVLRPYHSGKREARLRCTVARVWSWSIEWPADQFLQNVFGRPERRAAAVDFGGEGLKLFYPPPTGRFIG